MKNYTSFSKSIPSKPKSADDDDEPRYGVRMFNEITPVNDVDVYLDENINEPAYYRNLLQYLRRMEERDTCKIWLTTNGGRFDSSVAIIEAMQNSRGQVQVIASGYNASAGTLIALAAPELIVTPNTSFMFHAASHGGYGKLQEVQSQLVHNHEVLIEFMWKCYEGFLTREEFNNIVLGVDRYMKTDEIMERLEKRAEYQKDIEI